MSTLTELLEGDYLTYLDAEDDPAEMAAAVMEGLEEDATRTDDAPEFSLSALESALRDMQAASRQVI